ncbi:hypothetical protein CEXT_177571 [Caerostris extrusa]|uniref:Uncharacterized protein n=1 Tax=Caerostris extrusa TaxID=172846 RepID=A0AAV4WNW5_CAEEX|nr:hypothetical protein CEXT_177571 [Caerostris extrusa]
MINLNHVLIKVTRMSCKTRKSDFAERHRPLLNSETGQECHLCTSLGTLSHPAFSIVLTNYDYYFSPSMSHEISMKFFNNYKDEEKCLRN